jgi:hypothetical protein
MVLNRTRKPLLALATAGVVSTTMLIGTSAPASAATVPNNYYCSIFTNLCVQINGPHVNGIPNACTRVWNIYTTGSPTSICNIWR